MQKEERYLTAGCVISDPEDNSAPTKRNDFQALKDFKQLRRFIPGAVFDWHDSDS